MSAFRGFFQPPPLPGTFFGRALSPNLDVPSTDAAAPPAAPDQPVNSGAGADNSPPPTPAPLSFYHVEDDVMSDAQPDAYGPGEEIAKNLFKGKRPDGVTFEAYLGPPAGGTEHARQGSGESYHFHLNQAGEKGPRISSETVEPLTPDDARLFTGKHKQAIEALTEPEKWYIGKATRDIFHTGNISPRTIRGFGWRSMRAVPFAIPQDEDQRRRCGSVLVLFARLCYRLSQS